MAPQEHIPLSANVLGTIGTVFWCIQLVPQIWKNWREKAPDGLPHEMMLLWAACGPPFGVYAIVQNFNIPLQIQPQIFTFLALISWAQIRIYGHKSSTLKVSIYASIMALSFAGIEVLLVLTLRGPYARGTNSPIIVVGVVAAVLLAGGLVPPYLEIFRRQGRVIGLSFLFLGVDWLGAFFSLMALVAQQTFDVLGGVLYILCLALETGIFASHIIWLFRFRHTRRAAKEAGMPYEEFISHGDRSNTTNTDEEKGGLTKIKSVSKSATCQSVEKQSNTGSNSHQASTQLWPVEVSSK